MDSGFKIATLFVEMLNYTEFMVFVFLFLDPYGNQFLSIAFSKEQFSGWLENLVPGTIILGAVSLGYHIVSSLFRYKQSSSPINHVAPKSTMLSLYMYTI